MILKNYFTFFEDKLRQISLTNYNTSLLGLSRSLLAVGTLLTLLINPTENFIYELQDGVYLNPLLSTVTGFNKYNFFLLLGFENIFIMKILAIILLLLVVSGYYIKLSSIFHWWICVSFIMFSSAIDGGDQIANNLTFLLVPICLFDKRLNHWHKSKSLLESNLNFIPITFALLIRLQMAVIYFHSATGKFNVPEWSNGTAIYYWLNHTVFGMPYLLEGITNELLENKFIVVTLTYCSMILELILFLSLGMNYSKRKYLFIPAIIFHFLIVVYHGIFSFFFSMAAGLIFLLLDASKNLKIKRYEQE